MDYAYISGLIVDVPTLQARIAAASFLVLDPSYKVAQIDVSELAAQLPVPVIAAKSGVSIVAANGTLAAHVDTHRLCAVNVPLAGDFSAAPHVFLDGTDGVVGQCIYADGQAALIDVTVRHKVVNLTAQDRVVVSITLDMAYADALSAMGL